MRRTVLTVLAGSAITALSAQAPATTGFKLGTFERKDTPFVGVVLRDAVVIDLAAADAAVMPAPSVAAPRDMKDLIARYDKGVRGRILELIARVNAAGAVRPSWVIDLSSLKTLPPIMYPQTMLNMAVNYREHALKWVARPARPRARVRRCRDQERAWHLGTPGGRHAVEPVFVHQAAVGGDCRRRVDPVACRPRADRLGVRARRRHRGTGIAGRARTARVTTSSATRSKTTCRIAAAAATRVTAATG